MGCKGLFQAPTLTWLVHNNQPLLGWYAIAPHCIGTATHTCGKPRGWNPVQSSCCNDWHAGRAHEWAVVVYIFNIRVLFVVVFVVYSCNLCYYYSHYYIKTYFLSTSLLFYYIKLKTRCNFIIINSLSSNICHGFYGLIIINMFDYLYLLQN